jgi:phosphate:Na+ symporter
MSNQFDFWQFIAGLGIFLFGMYHLESGLKGVAGNSLKHILERFTDRKWKGILTGAGVTAVLQSSSLVTLLTVAFLGSGIISLQNSLSVVLGANLGTTATAWIVANLGFKVDMSDFAFPFLAIGILSYLFMDSRPGIKHLGSFLTGFGLLFLGLDFMKLSITGLAENIDMSFFNSYGLWAFLVLGLIITAMIQSSSAVIVIVLSALYANLIDIYQSVAVVIGANIGTTSTLVIASVKGSADKKRLAYVNVFFKVVASLISFTFLSQLVYLSKEVLSIETSLMQLVAINTLINLIGIIIFYPFLDIIGRQFNKFFIKNENISACKFINKAESDLPQLALEALKNEIALVSYRTRKFIFNILGLKKADHPDSLSIFGNLLKVYKDPIQKYDRLKHMEDEITDFYISLQVQELSEKEAVELSLLMRQIRALIYAAKNIKDIQKNVEQIKESNDGIALEVLKLIKEYTVDTYKLLDEDQIESINIDDLYALHNEFYEKATKYIYSNLKAHEKHEVSVSTLTNVVKKFVGAMEEISRAAEVAKSSLQNVAENRKE